MATTIRFQLTEGKGLSKAIVFRGLKYSAVVHPTIHGEPILTSQAFYYLDHLEAVATIRFESSETIGSDHEIEYVIDNYLFEYSKLHEASKISTKVMEPLYWTDDYDDMYFKYDRGSSEALTLDMFNDESVLSIEPLEEGDDTCFTEYCLVRNYSDQIIETFLESMNSLVNKKIHIKVLPTDSRDGYFGKARLLKCDDGILNYHQAQRMDHDLSPDMIKPNQKQVVIGPYIESGSEVFINVEEVTLTKYYSPRLLSYYFSGLNERNPLKRFIGFYNVLEYYFEEAPKLLNRVAKIEKDQLGCVLVWLVTDIQIRNFIDSRDAEFKNNIKRRITTSSSVGIEGFDYDRSTDLAFDLCRLLYDIRCAIVHSKKSRKGAVTSILEPYSSASDSIEFIVPMIKWLATICIEKDEHLEGTLYRSTL